jgi:hypothetical protein
VLSAPRQQLALLRDTATTLNVFELLKAVNQRAVAGVLCNGDVTLRDLAEDLFERLNRAGA